VPDLEASAQVELGRPPRRRGLSLRGLPRQGPAVGVDVQDAESGLTPPRSPMFYDGDSRSETGDKAPDDEVRRVRAPRRGLDFF